MKTDTHLHINPWRTIGVRLYRYIYYTICSKRIFREKNCCWFQSYTRQQLNQQKEEQKKEWRKTKKIESRVHM